MLFINQGTSGILDGTVVGYAATHCGPFSMELPRHEGKELSTLHLQEPQYGPFTDWEPVD